MGDVLHLRKGTHVVSTMLRITDPEAERILYLYIGDAWSTTIVEDGIRSEREEADLLQFLIENAPEACLCALLDLEA